jgi:hypothetical protein
MAEVATQRRAVLLVTGRFLTEFFRNGRRGRYEITHGIPKDGVVVGAHYDSLRDRWEIAIESDSYPQIAEGCELPRLPPVEITTFWEDTDE